MKFRNRHQISPQIGWELASVFSVRKVSLVSSQEYSKSTTPCCQSFIKPNSKLNVTVQLENTVLVRLWARGWPHASPWFARPKDISAQFVASTDKKCVWTVHNKPQTGRRGRGRWGVGSERKIETGEKTDTSKADIKVYSRGNNGEKEVGLVSIVFQTVMN